MPSYCARVRGLPTRRWSLCPYCSSGHIWCFLSEVFVPVDSSNVRVSSVAHLPGLYREGVAFRAVPAAYHNGYSALSFPYVPETTEGKPARCCRLIGCVIHAEPPAQFRLFDEVQVAAPHGPK